MAGYGEQCSLLAGKTTALKGNSDGEFTSFPFSFFLWAD